MQYWGGAGRASYRCCGINKEPLENKDIFFRNSMIVGFCLFYFFYIFKAVFTAYKRFFMKVFYISCILYVDTNSISKYVK